MSDISAEKEVYLDNAATTRLDAEVLDAMMPYLTDSFHNPSAIYGGTFSVREAIETAKKQIASAVGCEPDEVFFTSGGTEADNWAIRGYASNTIVSAIEHKAILELSHRMRPYFKFREIPVTSSGVIDLVELANSLRTGDFRLVSVMYANNEIGTIQPLKEISGRAHQMGALFHTDAVQAIGHVPVDMRKLGVDMLSMSAHKFHGPKGIGALCVRKQKNGQYPLGAYIVGGSQQKGMRAGTENVPGIVGMGKAIELAARDLQKNAEHEAKLRNLLRELIVSSVPDVRLNGPEPDSARLPNNLNLSFKDVEGQQLLLMLDLWHVSVSAGSACNTESISPSHVLQAIQVPQEYIQGTVRFSLSKDTTEEEIRYAAQRVGQCVKTLRGELYARHFQ